MLQEARLHGWIKRPLNLSVLLIQNVIYFILYFLKKTE